MILPTVPDDDYHNGLTATCLAMAHMDWVRLHAEQFAAMDNMLDTTWKRFDEWERGSEPMASAPCAAALWIGHRYFSHMGQYGRLGADVALACLVRHVKKDEGALDTPLSKTPVTWFVMPLLEGFLERLAAQQHKE